MKVDGKREEGSAREPHSWTQMKDTFDVFVSNYNTHLIQLRKINELMGIWPCAASLRFPDCGIETTCPPEIHTTLSVCQMHKQFPACRTIYREDNHRIEGVKIALNTSIYTSVFVLKHLVQRYTAPPGYQRVKEKTNPGS